MTVFFNGTITDENYRNVTILRCKIYWPKMYEMCKDFLLWELQKMCSRSRENSLTRKLRKMWRLFNLLSRKLKCDVSCYEIYKCFVVNFSDQKIIENATIFGTKTTENVMIFVKKYTDHKQRKMWGFLLWKWLTKKTTKNMSFC